MIFNCDWDIDILLWTIGIGFLLLAVLVVLTRKSFLNIRKKNYLPFIGYSLLIILTIYIAIDSAIGIPVNISTTDNTLKINRLFNSSIDIPYHSIKEIRKVTAEDLTGEKRMSSSSTGFGGHQGNWMSNTLGKYEKFTTNTEKQLILITTDNRSIMFSCDNPDLLVSSIPRKNN